MVLRYESYPPLSPDFQCGLVGAVFGGACFFNCFACVSGIGPMSNELSVLVGYPNAVFLLLGIQVSPLRAFLVFRPLSPQEIQTEIASNRPIVVGISPGGFALPNISEHIAVIVGYDFTGGRDLIMVNDPFPFELFAIQNPYIANGGFGGNGRYVISATQFALGLEWNNTIYGITRL